MSDFYLLTHYGNSVYKDNNNFSNNYLNSLCLLSKTITTIYRPKEIIERKIDFTQMIENDKINNEKAKFNSINDISSYNSAKNNFIHNIFYNDILKNKQKYENINNESKFRMLKNEDKSTSSLYYHIQIIEELEKNG